MDDRTAVAWLLRRVGSGAAPGELDRLAALGVDAVLDRLVDPDLAGVAPTPDPWAAFEPADPGIGELQTFVGIAGAWLDRFITTERPAEDWMAWFWHDHFAVDARKVESQALMLDHIRLLWRHALGNVGDLLRAVTVDGAMLLFLDGATSVAGAPNENYSRELLELYALGIGEYTEADVAAGARALTGWIARPRRRTTELLPERHDPAPHSYLGRSGVADVDAVIDAVLSHEACAPFLARKLAASVLGPDALDDALVARLGGVLLDAGYEVRPLLRVVLEEGLDGRAGEVVAAPVPWLVSAQRALGAPLGNRVRLAGLRDAEQVPLAPPSVAGWPSGAAWLATGSLVARQGLAIQLAAATPDGPARSAARAGAAAELADALCRPEGFRPATAEAVATAASAEEALVLALLSPDGLLP